MQVAGVGLAIGTCGCVGYTADRSAYGEDPAMVGVVEPRLRLPGDPETVELAPPMSVHDVFDVGAPLRDGPERGGVPWRPPS